MKKMLKMSLISIFAFILFYPSASYSQVILGDIILDGRSAMDHELSQFRVERGKAPIPIRRNMGLYAGDVLETDGGANALLVLGSSVIALAPGTRVRLKSNPFRIYIDYGDLYTRTDMSNCFSLETPWAKIVAYGPNCWVSQNPRKEDPDVATPGGKACVEFKSQEKSTITLNDNDAYLNGSLYRGGRDPIAQNKIQSIKTWSNALFQDSAFLNSAIAGRGIFKMGKRGITFSRPKNPVRIKGGKTKYIPLKEFGIRALKKNFYSRSNVGKKSLGEVINPEKLGLMNNAFRGIAYGERLNLTYMGSGKVRVESMAGDSIILEIGETVSR